MKAQNETQNINGFDLNKGTLKNYLNLDITYRDKEETKAISTATRLVKPSDIDNEYKTAF